MAACSLRCAMFTDPSLFLPTRRVSAIGLVQLAAVLATQCLAQLARAGIKPGGSSYLWPRHAGGNASAESTAAKQMICTALCLLFLSLLLGISFYDIQQQPAMEQATDDGVHSGKRQREHHKDYQEAMDDPQHSRGDPDEERHELLEGHRQDQ